MATIVLKDIADMQLFGEWLARNIPSSNVRALFLHGPLGSGKTSLTRAFIKNLSGSDNCEVSSPSYTVLNHYPTLPPVVHCDLYRCPNSIPEEILDIMDSSGTILIVEWANFFPNEYRPEESLDIFFKIEKNVRCLTIKENGIFARRICKKLFEDLKSLQNNS